MKGDEGQLARATYGVVKQAAMFVDVSFSRKLEITLVVVFHKYLRYKTLHLWKLMWQIYKIKGTDFCILDKTVDITIVYILAEYHILGQRLRWHNRLARRTYRQYLHHPWGGQRHAEVVSSILTRSSNFFFSPLIHVLHDLNTLKVSATLPTKLMTVFPDFQTKIKLHTAGNPFKRNFKAILQ